MQLFKSYVISFLVGSNIFFNTLLLNTVSLYLSLNEFTTTIVNSKSIGFTIFVCLPVECNN